MPAAAFVLALASAFVHALWNLLLARARDTEAATAVALGVGAAAFAPVAVLTWDVEASAIPYVAVSGALELGYLALLAAAYEQGELSLIYPVARGSAPVLITIFNVAIVGAALNAPTAVGVLVVAAGIVLVRGRAATDPRHLAMALVIGTTIASYTLVDKAGLKHADPLPYLELVLLPAAVLYPLVVRRRKGAAVLRSELRPSTLVAGLSMFGAYGLVLAAVRRTPQAFVPAVGALRETSVVIAVVAAALILHEHVDRRRALGAVVVVAGVAVLALG
jgi:uncharacterized membrane protein